MATELTKAMRQLAVISAVSSSVSAVDIVAGYMQKLVQLVDSAAVVGTDTAGRMKMPFLLGSLYLRVSLSFFGCLLLVCFVCCS